MKIAIDLDQCMADQNFFRIMCHLLHPEYQIHIITNGDEGSRRDAIEDLEKHRIQYSKLVFTANKVEYLQEQGIEIEID
jgi:hypothetical protein